MSECIDGPAADEPRAATEGRRQACGQVCGEGGREFASARPAAAMARAAEILGNMKAMQINELHEDVSSMTAVRPVFALRAAAVEFHRLAGPAFRRG